MNKTFKAALIVAGVAAIVGAIAVVVTKKHKFDFDFEDSFEDISDMAEDMEGWGNIEEGVTSGVE